MTHDLNIDEYLTTFALHEVMCKSEDLDSPLFRHYPAMKLGDLNAVRFFAGHLVQQAINIIRTKSIDKDLLPLWVITAPAYCQLPAGANLLARDVYARIQDTMPMVEFFEARLTDQKRSIQSQKDFDDYYNYSRNSLKQRTDERKRVQDTINTDQLRDGCNGKYVLVINDINVTGTQQQFMHRSMLENGALACYWLYIFNVDTQLAMQNPAIEHAINHSQLSSEKEFIDLLNSPTTHFTARCISRLFNEKYATFASIVAQLTIPQRQKIYHWAKLEGRYAGKFFSDKRRLLAYGLPHVQSSQTISPNNVQRN